ncbi:MAG: GIY-YIG nuclease family protein [bacterium]|nr:GIY-YIG nuclease family protein [bacterium]
MYYTYILQSEKNSRFYTGHTSDLRKRLAEHQNKAKNYPNSYTKGKGPFVLIYYEACKNKKDARSRELYLKSGMGKRYIKNRLKNYLSSGVSYL